MALIGGAEGLGRQPGARRDLDVGDPGDAPLGPGAAVAPTAPRRWGRGAGWTARRRPATRAASRVNGRTPRRPASRISVNHPSAVAKRPSSVRLCRQKEISATVGAASRSGSPDSAARLAASKSGPSGCRPEATEVSQTAIDRQEHLVAVDQDRLAHLLRRGEGPGAGRLRLRAGDRLAPSADHAADAPFARRGPRAGLGEVDQGLDRGPSAWSAGRPTPGIGAAGAFRPRVSAPPPAPA